MNNLRNSVRLIGTVGQDPEITVVGKKKRSFFILHTDETYKNKEGKNVTETTSHCIIAWDKHAEIAEKYLLKGNEVALEGKMINIENSDEGRTEIHVNEIIMLGRKRS